MGNWRDGLYWVEYADMDESRIPEVDEVINKAHEFAFDLAWDTTPNYTVGFDADGCLVSVKAWGFTQDGEFPTIRVDIPRFDDDYFPSWQGAGWYAPKSVDNVTVWYAVPGDRDEAPDTYGMGLGTPQWFDEEPGVPFGPTTYPNGEEYPASDEPDWDNIAQEQEDYQRAADAPQY